MTETLRLKQSPYPPAQVSKKTMDTVTDDYTWTVVILTTGHDCHNASLLLGLGPNCGQAGHCKFDCPTLPRQSKVRHSHLPPPQESLSYAGPDSQDCCLGTLEPNVIVTKGAWGKCLGEGLWTSLCHSG